MESFLIKNLSYQAKHCYDQYLNIDHYHYHYPYHYHYHYHLNGCNDSEDSDNNYLNSDHINNKPDNHHHPRNQNNSQN